MATHEERLAALETKYQHHDTQINGQMGIITALQDLQKSVNDLKAFQIKILSYFGAAAIFVQVIVQLFLNK